MKMININVGNNTLQIEKGTSVQRLIELMESNSWNPSEWTITYVFPEENEDVVYGDFNMFKVHDNITYNQ